MLATTAAAAAAAGTIAVVEAAAWLPLPGVAAVVAATMIMDQA
jgi:hypothetical protein